MSGIHAWGLFDTALGRCGIAWNGHGITAVQLPDVDDAAVLARMRRRVLFMGDGREPPRVVTDLPAPTGPIPPHVALAIDGIVRLLRGEPEPLLHIELDMTGVPPFHRQVYACARRIAPGTTATYGEIARALGDSGAARAVGQALGHNPFAPVVPCHRVLAAGACSGGFSAEGGVQTKLRMLLIEKAAFGAPGLFD